MQYDPEILLKLSDELEKELEPYLKWQIICDRYERGKNSKIAELACRFTDGSYASREAQGLASEEFRKYLEEWHEADKKRIIHKVRYDTLRHKFDAHTSVLAFQREGIKRGIMA